MRPGRSTDRAQGLVAVIVTRLAGATTRLGRLFLILIVRSCRRDSGRQHGRIDFALFVAILVRAVPAIARIAATRLRAALADEGIVVGFENLVVIAVVLNLIVLVAACLLIKI